MILKPILLQYGITYILTNFVATQDLRGHLFIDKDSDSIFAMGIYKDFTSNWFFDVGSEVVGILYVNIFMPLVEWLAFFGIRYAYRVWD